MKYSPIISIIVPVYNVEKYLDRCIRSILNQTFKDFELILVNDGSTDSSRIICERYKKIDDRIRVIHKENGGLSSARNEGINFAKGKYIGFVDSDDYINKNMYYELYKALIDNNSDISICEFKKVYDDNKKVHSLSFEGEQNYDSKSAINILCSGTIEEKICLAVAWNKLYKKELFSEIRYPEDRKYEDSFIAHKLLYKCNNITLIKKELYYYYQREGSIINSSFSIKDLDVLDVFLDRIQFSKKIKNNLLKEHSIHNFIVNYFDLYYKVKYLLKDEYNTKRLKILIIKNYHYIYSSDFLRFKEKLAILVFILNENYYSKIIIEK